MGKRVDQTEVRQTRDAALVALPFGTPTWITPELVELTRKVWQPYYDEPLSVEDSITILRNTGSLLEALARR